MSAVGEDGGFLEKKKKRRWVKGYALVGGSEDMRCTVQPTYLPPSTPAILRLEAPPLAHSSPIPNLLGKSLAIFSLSACRALWPRASASSRVSSTTIVDTLLGELGGESSVIMIHGGGARLRTERGCSSSKASGSLSSRYSIEEPWSVIGEGEGGGEGGGWTGRIRRKTWSRRSGTGIHTFAGMRFQASPRE